VTPFALTGTPGTGKSSVGRELARRYRVLEVSELARSVGAARRNAAGWEVDLARISSAARQGGALRDIDLVVGHLAHLLPIREAVVLRCHPNELLARLRRARRGSAADRQANYVCEATDVVAIEARALGRRCIEIDTTGRSPAAVARIVARCLEGKRPPRSARVDWLADPRVTEHLLDGPG
jgi:adenylate kinase